MLPVQLAINDGNDVRPTPADDMPCTWQIPAKELETPWHRDWKGEVPIPHREVAFGRRRADVYTVHGYLLEFQHSYIPTLEIEQREDDYSVYGGIMWIFDATDAVRSGRLSFVTRGELHNYGTFRWRRPRTTLTVCRDPVWLDTGEGALLYLTGITLSDDAETNPNSDAHGRGRWLYTGTFKNFMRGDQESTQIVERIIGQHSSLAA